ncbi:MAG TPA: hypothetical protein VKM54_02130 [Myxococcota bacterium]|nr:hypothetical protein [Myxococcota bacterium]
MKKGSWGGPRRGAGMKPAPPETVRRNRVVVMLKDDELAKLHRLAEEKNLPLGTVAYEFVARGLTRRR